MTYKFKVNLLIGFALFGLIAGIWGFIDSILDKYYLSKDYRYTITSKIVMGSSTKTGTERRYHFSVKSKTYAKFTSSYLNRDSTYFIKYYPPNPKRNEATLVIANENDIKNLPPDGYKELPHK